MLKSGSHGDEVRELPEQLTQLGHDTGGADGIFGPKTDAAVRSFPRDHGTNVDGEAGQITMLRISAELKSRELGPVGDDRDMGLR